MKRVHRRERRGNTVKAFTAEGTGNTEEKHTKKAQIQILVLPGISGSSPEHEWPLAPLTACLPLARRMALPSACIHELRKKPERARKGFPEIRDEPKFFRVGFGC